MQLPRRTFLKNLTGVTAVAAAPATSAGAERGPHSYGYLGRTDDYAEFQIIEPGLTIAKIESWTHGGFGIVRLTTKDGLEGWGQLSPFEADITATVLHRQVAPQVLGSDPAKIDALVDRVIDANMKFPWSYICRALVGVDTAIWDLYGKIKGKPVCALLGGKTDPLPVYGSSMRRDITPKDEAERLVRPRSTSPSLIFATSAASLEPGASPRWRKRPANLSSPTPPTSPWSPCSLCTLWQQFPTRARVLSSRSRAI